MTVKELFQEADRMKGELTEPKTKDMVEFMTQNTYLEKEKEDLDVRKGQEAAVQHIVNIAADPSLVLTEDLIKKIHYLIYQYSDAECAGQYRKKEVAHAFAAATYPDAADIPHLMEHFIGQMEYSCHLMHPIEFAAMCHKRIMDIMPFENGSSCVARYLLNVILLKEGYPLTTIYENQKDEYVKALRAIQRQNDPDIDQYLSFIIQCVINAEKKLVL